MIKAEQVCKKFETTQAINNVSTVMHDGCVFGLVGTNGAGKSTFLRLLAGILRPDSGTILIDGQPVYEQPEQKRRIFYISDQQHFFSNATPMEMEQFYAGMYPHFNRDRFERLLANFELDPKRKIRTFSKGMKKQLSVLLGVSAGTDYILCDETFDGLDPVVRQAVKGLFASDIEERNLTPIIASHNLRELEDLCDQVGLLHRGGILFTRDLMDMKLGISKAQAVFRDPVTEEDFGELDLVRLDRRGSMVTITARCSQEELQRRLDAMAPIFFEVLSLSLEEIFITETEEVGYDLKKILE